MRKQNRSLVGCNTETLSSVMLQVKVGLPEDSTLEI